MTSPTENTAFDQTRLDKIRALQDKGITIFPSSFDRQHTVLDIKTKYADITHDKSEERVSTAGRIYIVRNHGKTVFADLGDETGKIQLYIRKNDLGDEQFDLFNQFIERGDIIGVTGHVFRTKLGEITIWVDTFTLLCKAVCSLPEKFHGLTDIEKRYRQRYVDLIVNEESRKIFRNRAGSSPSSAGISMTTAFSSSKPLSCSRFTAEQMPGHLPLTTTSSTRNSS